MSLNPSPGYSQILILDADHVMNVFTLVKSGKIFVQAIQINQDDFVNYKLSLFENFFHDPTYCQNQIKSLIAL